MSFDAEGLQLYATVFAIKVLIPLIVGAVLYFVVRKRARRVGRLKIARPNRLVYQKATLICLLLSVLGGFLVWHGMTSLDWDATPIGVGLLGLFGPLVFVLPIHVIYARCVWDEEGLKQYRLFRKSVHLRWDEVLSLSYSRFTESYVLHGPEGRAVSVGQYWDGREEFCEEAVARFAAREEADADDLSIDPEAEASALENWPRGHAERLDIFSKPRTTLAP